MGTDIHIVVERKWEGRWVGVRTDQGFYRGGFLGDSGPNWASPAVGNRNYAFFARLAGVRGDGPEALGLPDDASDLTLMRWSEWESDGHSCSYLPLKEFADRWCAGDKEFLAKRAVERLRGEDNSYTQLLNRASIGAFDPYGYMDVEDFRVVFWFDN